MTTIDPTNYEQCAKRAVGILDELQVLGWVPWDQAAVLVAGAQVWATLAAAAAQHEAHG